MSEGFPNSEYSYCEHSKNANPESNFFARENLIKKPIDIRPEEQNPKKFHRPQYPDHQVCNFQPAEYCEEVPFGFNV